MNLKPLMAGLFLAGTAYAANAQGYSIDWYKVAGGGGTSTNGPFSLSGTIGQPDAGGAMTGGPVPGPLSATNYYTVMGGYWSLVDVVQTQGAPTLYISHSGNVVTVYWQNVAGWSLIQSGNLTTPLATWPASVGVVVGATNSLTLTNPTGNVFYRLTHQ